MNQITLKLKRAIIVSEDNFDKAELAKFESASKSFEQMVEKGIAKKRGYQLASILGKYTCSPSPN